MKYMLLIYLDELALSETEREDCYVESTQLAQQIKSSWTRHHDKYGDDTKGSESCCGSEA